MIFIDSDTHKMYFDGTEASRLTFDKRIGKINIILTNGGQIELHGDEVLFEKLAKEISREKKEQINI